MSHTKELRAFALRTFTALFALAFCSSVVSSSPSSSAAAAFRKGGFRSGAAIRPLNAAFIDPSPLRTMTSPPFLRPSGSPLAGTKDDSSETKQSDELTKVGSSKYYSGFVSRSIDEESAERVTGDRVLGPTLKFAGGAAAILAALTIGFLASNGIV